MFRQLDPQHIRATSGALERRIAAHFPGSGLSRVSGELLTVAQETQARIEKLRRPQWALRLAVWASVLVLLGVAVVVPVSIQIRTEFAGVSDLLQGIEAAINNVVFVAIALYFLATVESRPKRRVALVALHELRCIAHIIDMHQLAKDPEHVLTPHLDTPPPERVLTRLELSRYLDYCSEMLSLTSKLAALYVQYLHDPVVLDAVNDVETLADGLSSKIWQKIMILDNFARHGESVPGTTSAAA